jgi:hypothetical protein
MCTKEKYIIDKVSWTSAAEWQEQKFLHLVFDCLSSVQLKEGSKL